MRKAIEHYEQALAIAREIGDRRGEGAGLGNLGNALLDAGETDEGIRRLEEALKLAQETENRNALVTIHRNLARAYASSNRFGDAAPHARTSLDLAVSLDLPQQVSHCARLLLWITLDHTGQGYAAGDAASALHLFSRSQEVAPHLEDSVLATEILHRYIRGLLFEHGMSAREHLIDVLNEVERWGRPEVVERLAPAAQALGCADEEAWNPRVAGLPPGEREAAEAVWDWMHTGHELRQAEKLIEEGKPQEGLLKLDVLLDREPQSAAGLILALQACKAANDTGGFERRLARALSQAPNDVAIRKFAARHAAEKGRHTDAISHLRRAVETDGNDDEAHARLGHQLCKAGRFTEAEQAFATAVKLDSGQKHPEWRLELAETRLLTGKVEEANPPLTAFNVDGAEPKYRAVFHYLRVYSALLRGDRDAVSREVSQFVHYWVTVPERIEITWNFDDLLAAASESMPESDVALLGDLESVIRGEKPALPFALAHGEEHGVEQVLAALSVSGKASLKRLDSGLVRSLSDIGLHAGRAAAVEAFFEAIEQEYVRLSDAARCAADGILIEAVREGGNAEKLMAIRAAGAHLLDVAPDVRGTLVRELLARAADAEETSDVRGLAVRILTIAYYDLPEGDQKEIEARLGQIARDFRPPALLEFLSNL